MVSQRRWKKRSRYERQASLGQRLHWKGSRCVDLGRWWKRWNLQFSMFTCVLGIQHNHPDLAQNYDPFASTDINDSDQDPMPQVTKEKSKSKIVLNTFCLQDNGDNKHGTRCAGEVAAVANNGVCGVGIAYNASIGQPLMRLLVRVVGLPFTLAISDLLELGPGPGQNSEQFYNQFVSCWPKLHTDTVRGGARVLPWTNATKKGWCNYSMFCSFLQAWQERYVNHDVNQNCNCKKEE